MFKVESFLSRNKKYFMGLITGALLASGGTAVANSIEAYFGDFKFIVNGVDKTPSNGTYSVGGESYPASIVYNGRAYLPIKFVSDLLDIPINYDSTDRAIKIGNAQTAGTYLSDMKPYHVTQDYYYVSNNDKSKNFFYSNWAMKIAGQSYQKGISFFAPFSPADFEYNLNGKYTSLSALIGLDDAKNHSAANVIIYGDNRILWRGTLSPGDLPQKININLSGVLQLKIVTECEGDISTNDYVTVDMVNPLLK